MNRKSLRTQGNRFEWIRELMNLRWKNNEQKCQDVKIVF